MNAPEPECLEHGGPTPCQGEVNYHAIDPGRTRAFPRCERHWIDRLERRETSMERYENCDVAPAWFDPTYAGERWDADY